MTVKIPNLNPTSDLISIAKEQGTHNDEAKSNAIAPEEEDPILYAVDGDYPDVPEHLFAGPHRSFPIRNEGEIKKAWSLRGHAENPEAVGRKIIRIAHREGHAVPGHIEEEVKTKGYGVDGLKHAVPADHRREEFRKLKELKINLCSDYGRLHYSESKDRYHLVTSDSDNEDAVVEALERIRAIVGHNRITSESEYCPPEYEGIVIKYGGGYDKDKKELAHDPEKATDSLISELATSHVSTFATDSAPYKVLSTDAKGKTVTVRQRAMRAEHKNLNNRFYKTAHVNAAIDAERYRIKAGAMHMDLTHPPTADFCSGGHCEERYASIPEHEAADVVDSGKVESDGWVWITYTTHDTPPGRKVKAHVDAGEPIGISTRFEWECHWENGMDVSDRIKIHTWDLVEDPAFPGTKTGSKIVSDAVLVSDSESKESKERAELQMVESEAGQVPGSTWSAKSKQGWAEGIGIPFMGQNQNMLNPPESGEPEPSASEVLTGKWGDEPEVVEELGAGWLD